MATDSEIAQELIDKVKSMSSDGAAHLRIVTDKMIIATHPHDAAEWSSFLSETVGHLEDLSCSEAVPIKCVMEKPETKELVYYILHKGCAHKAEGGCNPTLTATKVKRETFDAWKPPVRKRSSCKCV